MSSDTAAMFNSIAATYDFVNKTGSLGFDGFWRGRIVQLLKSIWAQHVLDIACGTGALSWKIVRQLNIQVTGLDPATKMLQIARKKNTRCSHLTRKPFFIEGYAEELPFEDSSFDAITIAFGIRNFQNRTKALHEAFRVLMPGGHLFILDFATPRNRVWSIIFRIYFWHILPFWGRIVSGNKNAYRYLPRSVTHFPQYEELCAELFEAGFSNVRYYAYTGGVSVLYEGERNR